MPAPNIQLTTTAQTAVTGAAKGSAVVLLAMTNTSLVPVTVTVHVVPQAGSVSDSTNLIDTLEIPSKDTYNYNEKLLLSVGQTVQALASANASITLTSSYLDL